MDISRIAQELVRDEGFVSHGYQDHLGYWTIGIGRLIDKRRGGGITYEEALYLLHNDIVRISEELHQKLDFFVSLDEMRKMALINMAFQLGIHGLMEFSNMLVSLKKGDFKQAYHDALDSRWARQTPRRAKRVATMIKEGE